MGVEASAASKTAACRISVMRVTVTIYGVQDDRLLVLGPRANVGDAVSALGVDRAAVGIMVLDGRIVSEEDSLHDKDALTLYPPLAGG